MKIDTYDKVSTITSHRVIGTANDDVGSILIAQGKLKPEAIEQITALQQREGCRFGEAAIRLGLITDKDLLRALQRQYDLPTAMASSELSPELVSVHYPEHSCTEELRVLRTQLLVRWRRRSGSRNVLAIVSPSSGDGRSYVAANLAVLFSQIGERTLLIDADFRKPRQHLIFDLPDRVGLSSELGGRLDRHAAVSVPGFPNLLVLPAGAQPPNPLELLSRATFGEILEAYARDFDVILVDTPPAIRYADAQAVGYHAGNAIVLTRRNWSRLADVNQIVKDLGESGVRVVGTVMNGR